MFKCLLLDRNSQNNQKNLNDSAKINSHKYCPLVSLSVTLLSGVLLIGCQQQSENTPTTSVEKQVVADSSQEVAQSDSVKAHIEQLKPVYVEQALKLQQRLQAEYEALQAADTAESSNSALAVDSTNANSNIENNAANNVDNNVESTTKSNVDNSISDSSNAGSNMIDDNANEANTEISVQSEGDVVVEEPDLTVLRSISFEPQDPIILTQAQIAKRYEQAIEALYQPNDTPLSNEEADTLINIATLIPQLFEHTELANRLSVKSPALARLIVQQQVWEQIQARQAKYMEEMKLTQQQEFESLMAKFDETIKGYDEQIAKYEQTLEEFQ